MQSSCQGKSNKEQKHCNNTVFIQFTLKFAKYLERIPTYIYPKQVKIFFVITREDFAGFAWGFLEGFCLHETLRFQVLLNSFKFQTISWTMKQSSVSFLHVLTQ